MKRIRIATRKSPLALWQAEHVRSLLEQHHPGIEVELIGIKTQGDKILDSPLAKIGGKGLFIKELEQTLFDGSADIAVHSMKDVPVELPEGLILPVILERGSPGDAFVSNRHRNLEDLPEGAVLGTSSLRRQSQVLLLRPDLDVRSLRGNVGTRLGKLDAGEFEAIILATAGLQRLELGERIRYSFDTEQLLPAIGQGAVGIECRQQDDAVQALIAPLHHVSTATCVSAERGINQVLFGGCQVPIAGHAVLDGDRINLRALVARVDGSEFVRGERSGAATDAEAMGQDLGRELLSRGADAILRELMGDGVHPH